MGNIAIEHLSSAELTPALVKQIRALVDAAFTRNGVNTFSEDDWQHALGGLHLLAVSDGQVVSHAAVVRRELYVAGRPLRTGYVEAVATQPGLHGRGYGTLVMRPAGVYIAANFELGALATGSHGFYERLGWQTWRGPTYVRQRDGETARSSEDDGSIMVLATPSSPALDLDAPISCEWRPGDSW
jgi:aminoglycoside 2'-N-acetyltransferase I